MTPRCSICLRKFDDKNDSEPLPEVGMSCPFCGNTLTICETSILHREEVLSYFRSFPRNRHEWEMTFQEKCQFINCVDTLETLIGSDDGELFCEAASAIGYGIPGGIFDQLIAILKRDKDFMLHGVAEMNLCDSPNECLRYAAMRFSDKRNYLSDRSSRIRAAAINHICDQEALLAKDSAGQKLCMKAAKKLNDEFAGLQMDYLYEEFGGSVFTSPSFRYPESKAYGKHGRLGSFLIGLLLLVPFAGFAGYWLGRYAQWRIKTFVIPDAPWWFAGLLMVAALIGLIFAYPQWVREEKEQKAKGRMKRDWPISRKMKKALKKYSKHEIHATILFGNHDGLDAVVFSIPGDIVIHTSGNDKIFEQSGMEKDIHALSEALRFSANFMIPCPKIVYPSPGFVTINIRYPDIGVLVMEERMDAMRDGNTLAGEVFSVALPKLLAALKNAGLEEKS